MVGIVLFFVNIFAVSLLSQFDRSEFICIGKGAVSGLPAGLFPEIFPLVPFGTAVMIAGEVDPESSFFHLFAEFQFRQGDPDFAAPGIAGTGGFDQSA